MNAHERPLYDPAWPYVVRADLELDFAEERSRADREAYARLQLARAIIKAHESRRNDEQHD